MTLAKPKLPVGGLAQGPNDLDKPAGDFLVAENVVHRRAGILEPLPGDENVFPDVELVQPARIFSDWEPAYAIRITKQNANDYGLIEYGPFDSISDPVTWGLPHFRPGECQCVYADGRHILSGAQFNVVAENIDSTSHDTPRRAGLPQLAGLGFSSSSGTSGNGLNPVVPAGKVCAWTAIVRRRIAGDRFIYSAPCSKVASLDTVSDQIYTLYAIFDDAYDASGSATYEEGDEILLYRTDNFDSLAEVNDTFYLSLVYRLTAADISARVATFRDNTLAANLGAELYTNPGAEGALKANIIPPCSSAVEAFNGTVFYVNNRSAPTLTATLVGSFGYLPLVVDDPTRQTRLNGIGRRTFSGNTTNLSANITNVSAADVVGLAVGQIIDNPGVIPAGAQIVSITGAGPYTVTVSAAATATLVGTSCFAYDAFRIHATKDGVTTTSAWSLLGSLDIVQTAISLNLVDDVLPTPNRMRGFVVNAGAIANLVSSSIYDTQVQLNFSVVSPDQWDSFTLEVTNPNNWVESDKSSSSTTYRQMSSVQETRRNVVWYAKTGQPEHVSPIQFFLVGAGTCYRLLNVQSVMLAFCSDGIFKIEGQGDQWIIRPLDSAARLVHPDCAVANNSTAFAWLESGLALCTEAGTDNISRDAIGPALEELVKTVYSFEGGPKYTWGTQMGIDRLHNEVWLSVTDLRNSDQAPVFYGAYIFNTQTGKFTSCSEDYTALCYYPTFQCLLFGKPTGLFASTTIATDFKVATVVYLPLVENAGEVKQWVDVNYFFDEVPTDSPGSTYTIEALFGGELTSSTNQFILQRANAPAEPFALHSLVPRRCGRAVKLVFGFRTTTTADAGHPSGGFYFQFKGAAVRARVASQIIKR